MFVMYLSFYYVFAKNSLKCCLTLILNGMSSEGVNYKQKHIALKDANNV